MVIDFDEVRPDRFVIHNDKVRPLLKGEGVTNGIFFELVTWRREGLLARIRERGFNVRTLADRVAALPKIGSPMPLGAALPRPLSQRRERFARFDRETLRWRDITPEEQDGKPVALLRDGEALRRRKSRGGGDFFVARHTPEKQVNLLPLSETDALLHAYAQLTASGPVTLNARPTEEGVELPQDAALLPEPHRTALDTLSLGRGASWVFPPSALDLARTVLTKLGITLRIGAKT